MKKSNTRKEKLQRVKSGLYVVSSSILFAAAMLILGICTWINAALNISLENLLYTLVSPIKGTSSDVIKQAFSFCFPFLGYAFVYVSVEIAACKIAKTYGLH